MLPIQKAYPCSFPNSVSLCFLWATLLATRVSSCSCSQSLLYSLALIACSLDVPLGPSHLRPGPEQALTCVSHDLQRRDVYGAAVGPQRGQYAADGNRTRLVGLLSDVYGSPCRQTAVTLSCMLSSSDPDQSPPSDPNPESSFPNSL